MILPLGDIKMKKVLLFGLVMLIVLSACSTSRQRLSPQGNLNLKSANVYYTQKDNDKSLEKALALYNQVLADNPNHVVSLKRTADINFYYATQIEPQMIQKDGIKEYQNMNNAKKVIDFYVITYGKYDSVLTVLNGYEKLTEDERTIKRDAQKKKEGSWVRIFKIGQLLFETKKFDDAVSAFEIANKLDPTKQEPLRMLVAVYQEMKNADKVEFYLNKVLATSPDDAEMIKMLGAHYYNKKEYEKAIGYFKKTQIAYPLDVNNLLLLSAAYTELKQYQNALETLGKVLKLQPDNLDAIISSKDLARALENKTAEIDFMKKIIAIDPSAKNLEEYCLRMINFGMYDDLMSYAEMWYDKNTSNTIAISTCILVANKIGRKDISQKYEEIYKALQPK
jgi:tetratricopeptide (TPR) repeat protein